MSHLASFLYQVSVAVSVKNVANIGAQRSERRVCWR
jgi:hypothetical protein